MLSPLSPAIERCMVAAAWVASAAMGVVVVARFAFWDERVVIVAMDALSPLLVAPAWVVLAFAVLRRHVLLGGTCLALALGHVLIVAPELAARTPLPSWAGTSPTFTVFDANVQVNGGEPEAYAAAIRRYRPALVVLQESTPQFAALLRTQDLGRHYPFVYQVDRADPFAMTVLSSMPFEPPAVHTNGGRPLAITTSFDVSRRRVHLVAAHAIAPFGGNRSAWQRDLDAIRRAAQGRSPVVVVGDLNATWNHRGFRSLLDSGLQDSAAARGRFYDATWPRGLPFVPPLMRLDHVLTGRGAVTVWIRTGNAAGSDHRFVVAKIAIHQDP